jgi:hypothetical protein
MGSLTKEQCNEPLPSAVTGDDKAMTRGAGALGGVRFGGASGWLRTLPVPYIPHGFVIKPVLL